MNRSELPAMDNRKSNYNKAHVLQESNTMKGIRVCESYTTKVCYLDDDGKFHRTWDSYSATTMKHVNDFRLFYGLPKISKNEWENIPVDPQPMMRLF